MGRGGVIAVQKQKTHLMSVKVVIIPGHLKFSPSVHKRALCRLSSFNGQNNYAREKRLR